MLRQIKRWWRLRRSHVAARDDSDMGLKTAMRDHLVSIRMVRMQAAKSAKVLQQLSDLLAVRAKAIDSIAAAEDALSLLDKGKSDDDKQ